MALRRTGRARLNLLTPEDASAAIGLAPGLASGFQAVLEAVEAKRAEDAPCWCGVRRVVACDPA